VIWLLLAFACTDINDDDILVPPETDAPTFEGPERVLIVNGKLSNPDTNYTTNRKDGDNWVGSELFVWDPADPEALRTLGRLDFGPDNPEYDWERMVVREVANRGDEIWVVMIDQGTNDEWTLGLVDVPDLSGVDQLLPVTPWVINPADTLVYSLDDILGASFDGDFMLLGSPANGAFPGEMIQVGPFPLSYEDPDNPYYATPGLASPDTSFPENYGVAGDIAFDIDPWAVLRPGNDFSVNRLWDGSNLLAVQDVVPSEPYTALGWANSGLFAVSIEGDVALVNPESGVFSTYADLRPLLPPDDLGQSTRRLRGAATMVMP